MGVYLNKNKNLYESSENVHFLFISYKMLLGIVSHLKKLKIYKLPRIIIIIVQCFIENKHIYIHIYKNKLMENTK